MGVCHTNRSDFLITTIPLTLKREIPEADYIKLMSWCVPLKEGGMYKQTAEGKVFDLHLSHIRGANRLLSKLGLPTISIEQSVKGIEIVQTGEKEDMSFKMSYVEDGLLIIKKATAIFVPESNINILWEVIKEKSPVEPRQVWSALSSRHALFPELQEIEAYIKDSASEMQLHKPTMDSWITALHQYKAGSFEGLRKSKKRQDANNYYSLYWFCVLLLKRLGLIEQEATRTISLTELGKETEDWKEILPLSSK